MTSYWKLVRDNIPYLIKKDGDDCTYEVLDDERYKKYLNMKLHEEFNEYNKEQNLEELCDLVEVIYAIAESEGYSVKALEKKRIQKRKEKGGFEKKILLKEVF